MTTRYHHGNLRTALVDAAVEVASEKGPDGLAVRDLARRVGVSHNAAYRHFSDRDALVEEVAQRGMQGLLAAMHARLDAVTETDPVERARCRLQELGKGYVDYALAEPGLFRVVFTAYPEPPSAAPSGSDPDDPGAAPDPYQLLGAALDDLVDVGFLHPDARPDAEMTCWSVVHGFAVLTTEGPLRAVPAPERDAALDRVLATIDRSYGATTAPRRPRDEPAMATDGPTRGASG